MMTGEAGALPTKGPFPPIETAWKRYSALLNPRGPAQIDYVRLATGAQGSMGVVTWSVLRCERLPKAHKLFFIPADKLEDLLGFAYRLIRIRFGDEFLFLNSSDLAYLLGNGADEVRALMREIPQWVLLLGIAGRDMFPEEKVEFQETDISEIAQQYGVRLLSSIPGTGSAEMLDTISQPSREPYWKLDYKGGFQDIFFLTTLERTPELVKTMYSVAEEIGYPSSDIGIYLQPTQQGVSCHCEFTLPYDPNNPAEVSNMKQLFTEASQRLLNEGAYFSRPYGIWADLAYNRDATTTRVLKQVKKIFDPNNVLNPGKLCF